MRRILSILFSLTLLVAACGGDSADGDTSTTEAPSTSEDSTTPPESSSSSMAEETTTTDETDSEPAFAITEVDFVGGTVTVTNVGGGTGSLDGYALCQRPTYLTIRDVELAPGESTTFEASSLGGFSAEDGEVGLYSTGSFDSTDAIVSYVEWGRSGHGRSSVAVAAGIWPADAFVATSADAATIGTGDLAVTSPDDWLIS